KNENSPSSDAFLFYRLGYEGLTYRFTIGFFLFKSSSSLHKAGAFKRAYHYSAGDERPFSELPHSLP
ncbi:hypothetical protein, partial [Escherichia coli]|uniref:hypothetical protein n=1 Tax=Escherichia coli TaxID=562 RepID=UPI0019677CD1